MLLGHDGQGRKHRDVVDEDELLGGRGDLAVDRLQAAPAGEGRDGEDRADGDEGAFRAERADEGGRGDRAERDGAHHEAPRDAEHAVEDLVRDHPLEERERSHVLDAVRGADDGQEDDGGGEPRFRGDQRDRQAPEGERDAEGRAEPFALERERGKGSR